jgi:hypothetical protein
LGRKAGRHVNGVSVSLRLADGETVSISDEEMGRVYDLLWGMVPSRGALTAAAKIKRATTGSTSLLPDTFDEQESKLVLAALGQLHGA